MTQTIKEPIQTNAFAHRLLEDTVDELAYQELIELPAELAKAWTGELLVDKALVLHSYSGAMIARIISSRLRNEGRHGTATRVEDMCVEMDRLITGRCLQQSI